MRFLSSGCIFFAALAASVLASPEFRLERRADKPKPGSKLATLHKVFMHDHHGGKVDFQSVQLAYEAQTLNPSEFGNDHHQTMVSESKIATEDFNRGADGSGSSFSNTCHSIDARVPWSEASRAQRRAWVEAVGCAYHRPGTFVAPNGGVRSQSLAEDFSLAHNYLVVNMHLTPPFLPCHRAFIINWMARLRSECDYQGPTLYLDLPTYADRGDMTTTDEIWGPDMLGSLTCPVEGDIFEDVLVRYIGSNTTSTRIYRDQHRVCRNFRPNNSHGQPYEAYQQSDLVTEIMDTDDYETFYKNIQQYPHSSFHRMINGDMLPNTSPIDALPFFGLHIYLDCFWDRWQRKNGGQNIMKYNGLPRETNELVSLSNKCLMLGTGPDFIVVDLMDSSKSPSCFSCPQ